MKTQLEIILNTPYSNKLLVDVDIIELEQGNPYFPKYKWLARINSNYNEYKGYGKTYIDEAVEDLLDKMDFYR